MKFQAERVGDVYMLRNSEVTVDRLQLSLASRSEVVEQSETMMVSSSDVHFYPQKKIRTRRRTTNPDCYSYGGTNSHKSSVDQRDHWVMKFWLVLKLVDLIKL